MILLLVAFIAIPYFFSNKSSQTTETTSDKTEKQTSWFNIYTPAKTVTPTTTKTTATTKTTTTVKTVTKTVATTTKEIVDPNQSKYLNKIKISSISAGSSDVKNESIIISNISQKDDISITGFLIETYERETFKIPKGYELPGLTSSIEGNIILRPGDRATIYVGSQERKMNFRENLCTGYFDQFSDFNGKLTHSCPKIDISKMLIFSANCFNVLNAIPKCRMFDSKNIVENECNEFATTHYSYVGCVNDFKTRTDFYSKKWLVWMQRGIEFFRNDRGLVILKDTEGKTVSEYQY
ncbi:MAG: hypothetical protein UT05_C0012G0002 [Parcubacteria group bacterium GW2011_GWF2_38_76]|nr:MAG: hypothetical protein UT05_C0012G0002 [Parcubacteria group bacterium GW2011_GWF2_38_76]